MKLKLIALLTFTMISSAAVAKTNWQGEVMVLAVSAGCAAGGDQVGDNYLATYQPKNGGTIVGNTTSNYLSFVGRRNTFSLKFAGLTNGVGYTSIFLSGRGNHLVPPASTITSISTAPAIVGATTPTLVINAVINNWFATPGCTATIRGAFVKRVD